MKNKSTQKATPTAYHEREEENGTTSGRWSGGRNYKSNIPKEGVDIRDITCTTSQTGIGSSEENQDTIHNAPGTSGVPTKPKKRRTFVPEYSQGKEAAHRRLLSVREVR